MNNFTLAKKSKCVCLNVKQLYKYTHIIVHFQGASMPSSGKIHLDLNYLIYDMVAKA